MPEFKQGKIYCIRSHQCEEVYVGSTTESLSRRMSVHRSMFKRYNDGKGNYCTAFEIVKYPDCYIELIEYFSCNTRAELNAREGHFIREIECVNKRIEGRSFDEWRDDNKEKIAAQKKQYQEDNKEKIAAYQKQYQDNNKEKIAAQRKQYYKDNKEKIAAQSKQYREDNKEIISNRKKESVQCMCGIEVSRRNLSRHQKTKTHRQAIFNLHNIFNHL
jgi:hypothetical protein